MKGIKFLVLAVLAISSAYVAAESLEERIAPAGSLCMAGDDCASVQVAAADGPRSGEQVYNSKCAGCHASGGPIPKLGDAAAWAPRIGKGMDVLYASAIDGFKGMPARGFCADCSDDEIKAAVDYIVDNSK